MSTTYEIIEYSQELPMKLFFQRIGRVSRHWHSSLELLMVIDGELSVTVEDSIFMLKEDDIILINANQVHETQSSDCVLLALQINLSMFDVEWLSPENITFECNSSLFQNKAPFDGLKKIIARLIKLNSSTTGQNLLLSHSYAYMLMNELVAGFKSEKDNEKIRRSQKHLDRLKSIIKYLDEHYNENITLKDLADREYLSVSYLSCFFEKHMGISFCNYLSRKRLDHSLPDLLGTALSIEEIAERHGFPSPRSFADSFRKQYGMLPSQYRKENTRAEGISRANEPPNKDSYLSLDRYSYLDRLAAYLKTEEGPARPAERGMTRQFIGEVSVKSKGRQLRHTFRKFCSVGRAREILYGGIRDMLRVQQQEIGFEYIKFHGIFDDALRVYREDSRGNPVYNFTLVDSILDFLLDNGLRPLVQLSFMPEALAKDPGRTLFASPLIISEPRDEKKWAALVAEFTRHLIERYGLQEIRRWIFTFWNETLNSFPFDFESRETFYRLYKLTRDSVKSCDQGIPFATTSYAGIEFPTPEYEDFLEFAGNHGCMPDVYLFHFYPIGVNHLKTIQSMTVAEFNQRHGSGALALSDDPDAFGKYMKSLNANLPGRPEIPLHITEWNLTPSHSEWLNDTCFSSVYIVRNILQNYDAVDSFCHWSLSDYLEEVEPSSELFEGGMGFFTKNGIKKPAYYAYYFLRQLEDIFIQQGEGYFVTKGENCYSILLYNYTHFSSLYGKGITFDATSTDRYNAFTDLQEKEIGFVLTDISNGPYILTEQIVNRSSGSAFDKWMEMGAQPLEKDEVETLKALSVPSLKKSSVEVANNRLDYLAVLEPLEIRLVILRSKAAPPNRYRSWSQKEGVDY